MIELLKLRAEREKLEISRSFFNRSVSHLENQVTKLQLRQSKDQTSRERVRRNIDMWQQKDPANCNTKVRIWREKVLAAETVSLKCKKSEVEVIESEIEELKEQRRNVERDIGELQGRIQTTILADPHNLKVGEAKFRQRCKVLTAEQLIKERPKGELKSLILQVEKKRRWTEESLKREQSLLCELMPHYVALEMMLTERLRPLIEAEKVTSTGLEVKKGERDKIQARLDEINSQIKKFEKEQETRAKARRQFWNRIRPTAVGAGIALLILVLPYMLCLGMYNLLSGLSSSTSAAQQQATQPAGSQAQPASQVTPQPASLGQPDKDASGNSAGAESPGGTESDAQEACKRQAEEELHRIEAEQDAVMAAAKAQLDAVKAEQEGIRKEASAQFDAEMAAGVDYTTAWSKYSAVADQCQKHVWEAEKEYNQVADEAYRVKQEASERYYKTMGYK